MKKITALFLLSTAFIHIALFVCHSNDAVYLWIIDLITASLSIILFTWLMLPRYNRKGTRPAPVKAYSQLSTLELLQVLQKANETEKAIEQELEIRYSQTHLSKSA